MPSSLTAAYGTPLHEDIDALHDFREKYIGVRLRRIAECTTQFLNLL